MPNGAIQQVEFKTRAPAWRADREVRRGPNLGSFLARLGELERDPSKHWGGTRDREMRDSLVIVDLIRDLRLPELERIRGYVERVAEDAR